MPFYLRNKWNDLSQMHSDDNYFVSALNFFCNEEKWFVPAYFLYIPSSL